MLPLLPFHALATQRGDGLRAEFLILFARQHRSEMGLFAFIEPTETELAELATGVSGEQMTACETDVSCAAESGHSAATQSRTLPVTLRGSEHPSFK